MRRDDELRAAEVAATLNPVLERLDELPVPPEMARPVRARLRAAASREADAGRALAELRGWLEALTAAVGDASARLEQLTDDRANRFGDAWWDRRREAARRGGPEAVADWARSFAAAVLAERFDVALRLADPEAGLVPPGPLRETAHAGASALAERWPGGAADLLEHLLAGPWVEQLPAVDQVDLEILAARAAWASGRDPEAIHERLEQVAHRARRHHDRTLESRVVAVMGEVDLDRGDLAAAERAFRRASDLAPGDPAGPVGLGMLHERDHRWDAAWEAYDRAAALVTDVAVLQRLFAPTPGAMFWRLSRELARQVGREEDALAALDAALERGMAGGEAYPERRALVDKGYVLERLGRAAESARAFFDGAERYSWSGELQTARGLLERAISLDATQAVYHWLLAEVLRLLAQQADGSLDLDRTASALEHWRDGARLRAPTAEEAWALVVYAHLRHDTAEPGEPEPDRLWDTVEAAERAVLAGPEQAHGWLYLSMAYGELGLVRCSLDAADRAPADPSLTDTAAFYRCRALAALGDVTGALTALPESDEGWLAQQRAFVQVLDGDPRAALATLRAVAGGDEVAPGLRMLRALCRLAAGDDARAAEDAWAVWSAGTMPDRHMAAWAGYLLGELDRAEGLLRSLLADRPVDPASPTLDLAQILLARGAPDDVRAGEAMLVDGTRRCLRWDTLQILSTTELPYLLRAVAGKPHAGAVADVVERVRPLVDEGLERTRRDPGDAAGELRDALGPHDGAQHPAAHRRAARLGLARLEADAGRATTALDLYLAAAADGTVEAPAGVLRAAWDVRSGLDGEVRAGLPPRFATAAYARLSRALGALDPAAPGMVDDDALGGLRQAVALRAGLCALLDGERTAGADWLGAAATGHAARAPRAPAVAPGVGGGGGDWRLTDELGAVRDDPGLPPRVRELAAALLDETSLEAVFRMRRSDVDETKTFPLDNPVRVALGAGLVPEDTGPDWVLFRELVPGLRERLRRRCGITIPGIRFLPGEELGPADYEVLWVDEPVRSGTVDVVPTSGDDPRGLAEVVAALEEVLFDNIARLFGPDDLPFWVDGLDPDTAARPEVRELQADSAARLRTHRVLRLLLREGVSIADPDTVATALGRATADGVTGVLACTAHLREALADRLPRTERPPVRLPAELERALAAGLGSARTDHEPVWEMAWERAADLVAQVRDWYASPDGAAAGAGADPVPVEVGDARLRPYLWRLLATGGRRVPVLTGAEVRAARAGRVPDAEEAVR